MARHQLTKKPSKRFHFDLKWTDSWRSKKSIWSRFFLFRFRNRKKLRFSELPNASHQLNRVRVAFFECCKNAKLLFTRVCFCEWQIFHKYCSWWNEHLLEDFCVRRWRLQISVIWLSVPVTFAFSTQTIDTNKSESMQVCASVCMSTRTWVCVGMLTEGYPQCSTSPARKCHL